MRYGYRELGPGPGDTVRSKDSEEGVDAESLLLCTPGEGMSQNRSIASTGEGFATTSPFSDFIVSR